jgi:hypothetical protein
MCRACDEKAAAEQKEAEMLDFLEEVERRAGATREEMLAMLEDDVRGQAMGGYRTVSQLRFRDMLRCILGEKP